MLGFCEKCRDMVKYHIKEKKMTKNIKGKEIEYIGKVAICSECESEIFVADVRDYSLKMLDNAFREKEGLISVWEMEIILGKYGIGKRSLASLFIVFIEGMFF